MTEIEVDELLQEAIDIVFRPDDKSVILIFPNKDESENAYKGVTEFFRKSELVLTITKKSKNILDIFLADNTGQFVHTRGVIYEEANLNNWALKNGDRQNKVSLYMLYYTNGTRNFKAFPDTTPITNQKFNKLNITSFEII